MLKEFLSPNLCKRLIETYIQKIVLDSHIVRKNCSYILNTATSNEKDLVILLTGSNEAAFEDLYRLYNKRLFGYFIKLTKSETLAAELLQDTFVRIWNHRENIDPSQSFRSYLFRIAENLLYDFFRKAARDKKLQKALVNSAIDQYSHVEEVFYRKENAQLLKGAIDALPPKRREVFQLVKIEERSYDEVSRLLNVSVSTINDHVVKATKSIREKMEQYHLIIISVLIPLALLSFSF